MKQGTVKVLDGAKGGFLSCPTGDHIFAHFSAIRSKGLSLQEDQAVTFGVATGPNGHQAKNVRIA